MLLKGGQICDFRIDEMMDLRIQDGVIVERGKDLSIYEGEEVLDCKGYLVTPALIDLGVYPKNKILSLENLEVLDKKCMQGGVGSVLFGADISPCMNTNLHIEYLMLANRSLTLDIYASALGIEDGKVSDISSLNELGAKVIWTKSEDLDGQGLMVLADYSKMLDMPLFLTPLDSALGSGVMDEGLLASELGLPGIPEIAYSKESAIACEIARSLGVRMILQIFDSASFELVRFARQRGARIDVQSSIHHLVLNEELCRGYNTSAKLYPPLKNQEARDTLLKYLEDGDITMLTSLQNACHNSQKDEVFELASSGIDEISNYFSLLYTFLVKPGYISQSKLSLMTSRNQAQALKLNKGALDVGCDADLIIIDREHSFVCQDAYSPYCGMELFSKVVWRMISGILQKV